MKNLKVLAALTGMLIGSAASAFAFPDKPVTIVVPVAAGGSLDVVGRYLADKLSPVWGQPVVVENRPGAGAVVGSNYVAQSKPDGYTLGVVSVTFTTTAAVQANLPYDPLKSFTPIAMLGNVPLLLSVGPAVPAEDMEQFMAAAKEKPLKYAATGPGSINQFLAEAINQPHALNMKPVHYQGGTEAMIDLIGGHVDLYFGTIVQLLSNIEGGKIRALMVTSKERADSLPNVPTAREVGMPEAEVQVWWGLLGPSGLPEDVTAKINSDVNAILAAPETAEFFGNMGAKPSNETPEVFRAHLEDELGRWVKAAEPIGLSKK